MTMDPIQPIGTSMYPIYPAFFPGVLDSVDDRADYLSSLDSDTRDYVVKHTDEFSSKNDLIDCVNRLHEES